MNQSLEGRLIPMELFNPITEKMEAKTIRMMSDRIRDAQYKPVFWSQLSLAYELYQRFGKGVIPPTLPDIVHSFLYMIQQEGLKGIAENLIELRDMTSTALIQLQKNKYRIVHGIKIHLNLETEIHEYVKDSNGNFTGRESFIVTTDIHTMDLQTFLSHDSYDKLRAGLFRMNSQQTKLLGKFLSTFLVSKDPRHKQQFIFHPSKSGLWRLGINKAGIACYDFMSECSGRGIDTDPDLSVEYQRAVIVPVSTEPTAQSTNYSRHIDRISKEISLQSTTMTLPPNKSKASSEETEDAPLPKVDEIRKLRDEFQREKLLLEKRCNEAEEQYNGLADKYQKLYKEKRDQEKRIKETEGRYQKLVEDRNTFDAQIIEQEKKRKEIEELSRQATEEKKALEEQYKKSLEQKDGIEAEKKSIQERLREREEIVKELSQEKIELEEQLRNTRERYQKSEERYKKSEERFHEISEQKKEQDNTLKQTREQYQQELSEQRRKLEEEIKKSREDYFRDLSKQKAELEEEVKTSHEAYQSLLEAKEELEDDYDKMRAQLQELEQFKKDLEVMSSKDRYLELLERYQESEGHKKDIEDQLKGARDLYQKLLAEKQALEENLKQLKEGKVPEVSTPAPKYDEWTGVMGSVIGVMQELQQKINLMKEKK